MSPGCIPGFFPTVAWPSEAVRVGDESITFIQKRVADPFYRPRGDPFPCVPCVPWLKDLKPRAIRQRNPCFVRVNASGLNARFAVQSHKSLTNTPHPSPPRIYSHESKPFFDNPCDPVLVAFPRLRTDRVVLTDRILQPQTSGRYVRSIHQLQCRSRTQR
jgi:hypothetical protein